MKIEDLTESDLKSAEKVEDRYRALQMRTAVNDTAKQYQKMIRAEAADRTGLVECISCHIMALWTEVDAGHYWSRAKHATIFDERNCHPQCKGCNQWDNSGKAKSEYSRVMLEMLGQEEYEELQRKSNKSSPWPREKVRDLSIMNILFKRRWQAAVKRLNNGEAGCP